MSQARTCSVLSVLAVIAGAVLVASDPASAAAGTTVRLGQSSSDYVGPVISSDGNVIVYPLTAADPGPTDLPPAVGTQLYLRDLARGTGEWVTVTTEGATVTGQDALTFDLSGDGSQVAFDWNGPDLAPVQGEGDCAACSNVYIRDRAAGGGPGVTYRASVAWDGTAADGASASPQISDDGRRVVFLSHATNLVGGGPADTPDTVDVFVRDLPDGPTRRLSDPDLRSQGIDGKAPFPSAVISADGSTVAWLAFTRADEGVLVVDDLATGEQTLLPGVTHPFLPNLSGDGRLVTFISIDSLVPEDGDGHEDGYLVDRDAPAGQELRFLTPGAGSDDNGWVTEISDDGTFVLAIARSGWGPDGTSVPADRMAIYRTNLTTGATDVVNAGVDGAVSASGDSSPWTRSMSSDGSRISFVSTADNLVAGDDNGAQDVFLRTYEAAAPPGTIDAVLDGSGSPVSTGAEARPELPVVLSIDPPAGLTGPLTAVPTPSDPAVPAGYSLFSAEWDTSLVISGPPAPAADPYVLTVTVDQSLLGGVAPADVQVFKDGAPVADCTGAGAVPDPCVAARSAAAGGDAVLTVRTTGFSTWSAGRLDYDLAGPSWPVKAAPAENPAWAGLPVVVPFRLGRAGDSQVLAGGSPTVAACGAGTTAAPLAPGSWRLTYVPLLRTYLFTWSTPRQATGCQELHLRFRDGSALPVRFRLR